MTSGSGPQMSESQSTDPKTLPAELARVYAFALPEREAADLVALCMRAARMLTSARDLLEKSKDAIFVELSDPEEEAVKRDIADWIKESNNE